LANRSDKVIFCSASSSEEELEEPEEFEDEIIDAPSFPFSTVDASNKKKQTIAYLLQTSKLKITNKSIFPYLDQFSVFSENSLKA